MQEITTLQRNTYDLMVEQGWMTPQAQTSSNIEKTYTQLKTVLEEMK